MPSSTDSTGAADPAEPHIVGKALAWGGRILTGLAGLAPWGLWAEPISQDPLALCASTPGIQTPDQQAALAHHNPARPVFVEGPFSLWLRNKCVYYHILRADLLPPEERVRAQSMSGGYGYIWGGRRWHHSRGSCEVSEGQVDEEVIAPGLGR